MAIMLLNSSLYLIQIKHRFLSIYLILYQVKHLKVMFNKNKSRMEIGKQIKTTKMNTDRFKIHLHSHFSKLGELLEQIRRHWCWKSNTLQPWSAVNKSLPTINKQACYIKTVLKSPCLSLPEISHVYFVQASFQPMFSLQSITQQVLFRNGTKIHRL